MNWRAIALLGLALSVGIGISIAEAQENIGRIHIEDVLLNPSFSYREPKEGEFQVGDSLFAVRWRRDREISGRIAVGNRGLLGEPRRYGAVDPNEIALVEAYAEWNHLYGKFRLGLVPLPAGLESGGLENDMLFERSLLYQKGVMGLRDLGFLYSIESDGFFSDWAIYNGESGRDLDNETWFTGRWGYDDLKGVRVGLTGTAGRTKPLATNPAGTNSSLVTAMDVDSAAKIRLAQLFFKLRPSWAEFQIEGIAGDVDQEARRSQIMGGHIDVAVPLFSWLSLLLRYDQLDLNTSTSGYLSQMQTLGFAYRSRYDTSSIFLYVSKLYQENIKPDSHQIKLVWRLTPKVSF